MRTHISKSKAAALLAQPHSRVRRKLVRYFPDIRPSWVQLSYEDACKAMRCRDPLPRLEAACIDAIYVSLKAVEKIRYSLPDGYVCDLIVLNPNQLHHLAGIPKKTAKKPKRPRKAVKKIGSRDCSRR